MKIVKKIAKDKNKLPITITNNLTISLHTDNVPTEKVVNCFFFRTVSMTCEQFYKPIIRNIKT